MTEGDEVLRVEADDVLAARTGSAQALCEGLFAQTVAPSDGEHDAHEPLQVIDELGGSANGHGADAVPAIEDGRNP